MSVSGDHPVDRDRITKLVSTVESVMPIVRRMSYRSQTAGRMTYSHIGGSVRRLPMDHLVGGGITRSWLASSRLRPA